MPPSKIYVWLYVILYISFSLCAFPIDLNGALFRIAFAHLQSIFKFMQENCIPHRIKCNMDWNVFLPVSTQFQSVVYQTHAHILNSRNGLFLSMKHTKRNTHFPYISYYFLFSFPVSGNVFRIFFPFFRVKLSLMAIQLGMLFCLLTAAPPMYIVLVAGLFFVSMAVVQLHIPFYRILIMLAIHDVLAWNAFDWIVGGYAKGAYAQTKTPTK